MGVFMSAKQRPYGYKYSMGIHTSLLIETVASNVYNNEHRCVTVMLHVVGTCILKKKKNIAE